METLLNRWRGTGKIIGFLTGNIIYALYITLLIGFVYFFTINGAFWMLSPIQTALFYGLISGGLYMLGESMGWGEWIGALTHNEKYTEEFLKTRYNDDEGYRFPFIYKTANYFFKKETTQGSSDTLDKRVESYLKYARLALTIRGFYWWLPILAFLGIIGLIPWYVVIINSLILAIGFPLACELGKRWNFEYKSKYLNMSRGWENQEVVYGFIQFICLTLTLILLIII